MPFALAKLWANFCSTGARCESVQITRSVFASRCGTPLWLAEAEALLVAEELLLFELDAFALLAELPLLHAETASAAATTAAAAPTVAEEREERGGTKTSWAKGCTVASDGAERRTRFLQVTRVKPKAITTAVARFSA
ncbi:MAG TPA: hypothetical protein VMB79_07595 [Jatrophihabitans sp.]|nr:hypothetical protein [Jatrophihabitans sp.]